MTFDSIVESVEWEVQRNSRFMCLHDDFVTICMVGIRLTVVCDMSRHEHITGKTSTTYEPSEEEKTFPFEVGKFVCKR